MNKLLIVDDSPAMRKTIARMLRHAEISITTVIEAGNGVDALAKLQSDPDIEVILSDIDMRDMSGVELLQRVRALHDKERMPVIMVTNEGGDALMRRALDLGANGYVTKPCSPDSIRRALEAYLG
jgi:two-component system chemotaxis response regulator CheY